MMKVQVGFKKEEFGKTDIDMTFKDDDLQYLTIVINLLLTPLQL